MYYVVENMDNPHCFQADLRHDYIAVKEICDTFRERTSQSRLTQTPFCFAN